jgi:endonuclease/exonuclease/phosphatase family metal-dependent hydrolase
MTLFPSTRSIAAPLAMLLSATFIATASAHDESRTRPITVPPVATWNVNMLPGATADAVVAILPKRLHVLALQGVSLPEHEAAPTPAIDSLDEMIAAMAPWYPYAYYVPPRQRYNAGCAPAIAAESCSFFGIEGTGCIPILANALTQCLTQTVFDLRKLNRNDVFASSCNSYLAPLLLFDAQCVPCVFNAAQENGGDGNAAVATCVAQQGPRFADGGSTGQLILSKSPIRGVRNEVRAGWGQRLANIYATIAGERYGFVSFPFDILADAGLTGIVPPLPGVLQPELAAALLAANPDVILGSFNSGPTYQPAAYNALQSVYVDAAPGLATYCTAAMIAAQDPRCVFEGFSRLPLAIDHVMFRSDVRCRRPSEPRLFNDNSGVSDHAGLAVCAPQ